MTRYGICRLCLFAFSLLALAACAAPPTPTATPTLLPSLTPSSTPDVQAAVAGTLTALAPAAALSTPALTPTASPPPTETPIVVTLPPLARQRIPPPMELTLPTGWETVGYDVLVLNDVGDIRGIPFAVYRGPLVGGQGTGTIVLLWGFPNLVGGNPFEAAGQEPDLWSDGLRLLRLAVLEQGCNIGTDLRQQYPVGDRSAVGTQFSAVGCPELPDARGWFAGVRERGLNFVFYAYAEGDAMVDPQRLDAYQAARDELQAILDTVRFQVPEVTATPAP